MCKIKILLITALLVMLEIMFTVKASAEDLPQLKLKYTDHIDEKHSCLEVELTDFEKLVAFSISIAYDKNNVQVCAYDEQKSTCTSITNKVLEIDEFYSGTSGYIPGDIVDNPNKWNGEVLSNDVYPFIKNDDGLLSLMFLRLAGEQDITGTQTAFKVYFDKINDNAPNIRLANRENTVIIDFANNKGAVFADFNGEIPYTVAYEGIDEPVGILDNSLGGGSSNGIITENIPSFPDCPGTSVSPTSTPKFENQENNDIFTDLGDALWAKEAIEYLSQNQIINGYGNGIFAPNKNITREELAKIIVTAKEIAPGKNRSIFTDSEDGKWYVPYLFAAYENNIVKGYPDGSFGVGQNITRQDLAVMVYRAFYGEEQTNDYETVLYNDSDSIADYAKEAVYFLTKENILNGRGENLFMPDDNATRAEAAKVIYMLYRR